MPEEKVHDDAKVFFLGDQHESIRKLRAMLEEQGYPSVTLPSLEEGCAVVRNGAVACIWMSRPKPPDPEKVKFLKDHAPRVPLIVASDSSTPAERCSLYMAGCDHYIGLDMDPSEAVEVVMARVRQSNRAGSREFANGSFRLDPVRRRIHEIGEPGSTPVQLGPLEFALLELLCFNYGTTVPWHTIRSCLWGMDTDPQRLSALVLRLRRKLKVLAKLKLKTVRRKGLLLRVSEPAWHTQE